MASFQAVLKMFEFYFSWYLTERILFLHYLGEVEMIICSVLFPTCSPCLSSCLFICTVCKVLLHMVRHLRAFRSYVSSVVNIFHYYFMVWYTEHWPVEHLMFSVSDVWVRRQLKSTVAWKRYRLKLKHISALGFLHEVLYSSTSKFQSDPPVHEK